MPYIDIKETIWRRYSYDEGTDMTSIIEQCKKNGVPSCKENEFLEAELLFDCINFTNRRIANDDILQTLT